MGRACGLDPRAGARSATHPALSPLPFPFSREAEARVGEARVGRIPLHWTRATGVPVARTSWREYNPLSANRYGRHAGARLWRDSSRLVASVHPIGRNGTGRTETERRLLTSRRADPEGPDRQPRGDRVAGCAHAARDADRVRGGLQRGGSRRAARARGGRGLPDRPAGARGVLPARRKNHRRRQAGGLRRHPPRIRVPERERRLRRGGRGGGPRVHRAQSRVHCCRGRQDPGAGDDEERRRAGLAGQRRPGAGRRRGARRG